MKGKNNAALTPDAQAIINAVDSYEDTVRAILALIHELRWDEKMKTLRDDVFHRHGAEHALPNRDSVTPDVSLQVGQDFVVMGDVKASFAREAKSKLDIAQQLMKYDEALRGILAGSGAPAAGATVLMTHYTRKVEATEYLKKKSTAFKPEHPFGLVAFTRADQGEQYITLELHHGKIVPKQKDAKLHRVLPIKLGHIAHYTVKFYDAAPPQAHLLAVLWDMVLPSLADEEAFLKLSRSHGPSTEDGPKSEDSADNGSTTEPIRRGGIPIDVRAEDLAEQLRESFSLRVFDKTLPGAPRTKAVKAALETLVKLGLAKRSDEGDGRYRVNYRKIRGGPVQFFAKKLAARPKGKKGARPREGSGQLKLFE